MRRFPITFSGCQASVFRATCQIGFRFRRMQFFKAMSLAQFKTESVDGHNGVKHFYVITALFDPCNTDIGNIYFCLYSETVWNE